MWVWRISNFADLSGEGARNFPGRWNYHREPVVYCADHPSTAILDILVNLEFPKLPESFQLLQISLPNDAVFEVQDLPSGWKQNTNYTRDYWQGFCTEAKYAALKVPSVIAPHTFNFLINPAMVQTGNIEIANATTHEFDERFRG